MFNHDRDTKSKIKSPCQFKERKKIRQINASQKENMTPSIGLNLRVTGYCNQGGRKYMEDVFRYALNYEISYPCFTGKSLSEALVFASTNPQYDGRLFIELQVQYMKIQSSNLGRKCCIQKLNLTFRTIFVHTQHVLPIFCKKKSF